MFSEVWGGPVGGGVGMESRTQLISRDFCNVRLAGTLVSMELICPYSKEERGMDLTRMP